MGVLPPLSMLPTTQCLHNAFLPQWTFHLLNAAQMAEGPDPVTAYNFLPFARKILHSQKKRKKKKKTRTHPVLIKSKSAEQSGGACPVEALHTSRDEQSARVGCHGVLYASCSLPLMTLFRIGNI